MKNALFMLAGVFVVGLILAATLIHDQPDAEPDAGGELPPDGEVIPDETDGNAQPANIQVTTPQAYDLLVSPFVLEGEARVFESVFNYRLKDAEGNVLVENHALAESEDTGEFGPFTVDVPFAQSSSQLGTLEVFAYSAMDGSEIDKVSIPVKFSNDAKLTVLAYFGNDKLDGDSVDCSQVFAVEREVTPTVAIAKAALDELLAGVTGEERQDGYVTSLNGDGRIQSLVIQNGVATVEFNEAFNQGMAGSCKVENVRAQIEKTLLQFSTVQSVVIKVEGVADGEVLQP